MPDSKQILELARNNNGIVTTQMVVNAGFWRGSLKYLADEGMLERTSRGVYALPDAWEDEFTSIQSRYKRGIFSLDTSLFLSDLTDRTPARFSMTFPAGYNMSNPKREGLACKSLKEPYYSLGITELTTPTGNKVKAYSAERTLCDILVPRNHTDIQLIADAFKRYIPRKERDIPLLSQYASILHVEDKLRSYLEVLL